MEQDNGNQALCNGVETAAPPDGQPPQAARERERRLEEREADVTRRELRAKAMETLCARKLPAELAELLDYTDEAACTASLGKVQKTWQRAVQKGVESRIAGSAPRAGIGNGSARGNMRDAISAYYGK